MICEHDQMVADYMAEHFDGQCEFGKRRGRKCDGLCDNCPFDYTRKVEKLKAEGKYVPDYSGCIANAGSFDYDGYREEEMDYYEGKCVDDTEW